MGYRNALNFVLSLLLIFLLIAVVPFVNNIISTLAVIILVIKLAEWLMEITRKYFLYRRISSKDKVVLITGCDTGFGNALARRMDKLGFSVIATCLNIDGEGAKKLSQDCSEKLHVLPMNVTDEESIQKVKTFVENNIEQNALWAVVNNAGILHCSGVEWTPLEELQRVCDVNIFGIYRVTKAFLPFIKKSKGRIVNVNSIGGRLMTPGIVGYCVSKSGAITLTKGLQMELRKHGIKCISIEPCLYATPLCDAAFTLADKSWNAAPKDVKEEYGENYIETFKNNLKWGLDLFKISNVSDAIDYMEDAITAENPLPVYIAGNAIHRAIFLIFYHVLPFGMSEWIFNFAFENH